MVLIAGIFMPNNYHVQAETPFPEEDIQYKNSVTIKGVKRTLYVLKNTYAYFQIGNEEPFLITFDNKQIFMDEFSTVVTISSSRIVSAWNYDIYKTPRFCGIPDPTGKNSIACLGEDIRRDDNDYAIAFKMAHSDVFYPIPTVDELREFFPPESAFPTFEAPASTSSAKPSAKPEPSVVPRPSLAPIPKPSPSSPTKKPKKKKEKSFVKGTSLYKGKQRLCKYTLKKKVLIFKVPGRKTFRRSGIKEAKYIQKSEHLVYVTVKGACYTRSLDGKNKCILKKNAKKIVCENKWAINLKKARGGYLNIRKK